MFKSMHWKIVLVYFLLSLLTMQFFGAYLIQSLERYFVNNYMVSLEAQGNLLASFLERYMVGEPLVEDIAPLIREYSAQSGTEIIVLDVYGRVVTSSGGDDLVRGRRILQDEVSRALAGSKGEAIRLVPDTDIRQKYLALPVRSGDSVVGVVYFTGSLEGIDATVKQVQLIFMTGTAITLLITVVLGFILARTITRPIQEVTSRAARMAGGDFNQLIEVRAEDEIGQLGEMFNHLTLKLKETLGEMSAEKSKVESILNYMTEGVVAVNEKGAVIHLNPAARSMLGDEFFSLFPRRELMGLLQSDSQETREIALAGPPSRVLKAHLAPFRTPEGNLRGVLAVLQDVTKEEELNRIQQEFVANVSHELKTPLTTVKSYVETLLNGAMEDPSICKNFLRVVEGETERMVRLVKDLLVLSRLDYRQLAWELREADLAELLQETARELAFRNPPPAPRLSTDLPPLAPLTFDRDKIKQVLLNVLGNAYKFTPSGGRITLRAFEGEMAVTVSVADTGPGIPAADVPRVFERFYRVDKTRSRKLGGTGLGLAIARQLVEAHGGRIWLESAPGEGTTVFFTLPRDTGPVREEAS
jgi:two-component system, OmpR family, sensor histidine kinase VicK